MTVLVTEEGDGLALKLPLSDLLQDPGFVVPLVCCFELRFENVGRCGLKFWNFGSSWLARLE